jgi:Dolichyl-phosphate-mannose-protein mannosyltransferase
VKSMFRPAILLPLVFGLCLRLTTFLLNRSLWMDESMFALNVALVPAPALVPMPFFEQVAAPLFVWLERASVLLFGVNEYALRLVPLLASCALLPATWLAGRDTIGPRATTVALWAVAGAPPLVRYAAEAKPYALDALVALVLVWLTARVLREPDRRNLLFLLVGGLIGLMLSVPVVLVLACVVVALLAARPPLRRSLLITALAAVWCAAFALLYVTVYQVEPAHSYLNRFWAGTFLSSAPDFRSGVRMILHTLVMPFVPWVSWRRAVLVLAFLALGATRVIRRPRWVAALLVGPLLVTILASFARVYPFSGRVTLFIVPFSCLLLAAGVTQAARLVRPQFRRIALIVFAVLAVGQTARIGISTSLDPIGRENPRVVVHDLLRRASREEPVYVFVRSVPNWLMYSTNWERPDTARALRLIAAASALGPNSGNAPHRGGPVSASEGASLVFPFRSTVEILGIPSGIENFDSEPSRPAPDSGWAEHEVQRMRRAAHPRIWLAVLHARDTVERSLLEHVCAQHGRVLYYDIRQLASAYYVDFSPPLLKANTSDTDSNGDPGANFCSEVVSRLRPVERF